MSQLFASLDGPVPGQVARAAGQPVWRDPETGFLRRSLSPPGPSPLEMIWGELPPGAEIAYPAASFAVIADQLLVVLGGQLTIAQGGVAHVLTEGDCMRFQARETAFSNRGPARCRYVVAILRAADHRPP